MNPFRKTTIALAIMLGLTFAPACAQTGTGGSVSVTVSDSSGASVPEAALELRSVETNDTHRAATGASGGFIFQNLPFGLYRLQVTKGGFTSRVFEAVEVQTGRVTDVPVALTLGSTSDAITATIVAASKACTMNAYCRS